MAGVELHVPRVALERIWDHLLGHSEGEEEAAFIFARHVQLGDDHRLVHVEHRLVPESGFAVKSAYFIELTDDERAAMIKRAHDLGAAPVELHSHPFQDVAGMSPSDITGLRELVPHVRWRLRGAPYAAVVVAPGSFDALAWADNEAEPSVLAAIVADGQRLHPTGRSETAWSRGGTW